MTLEYINQEYTNLCSKLGDLEVNYLTNKHQLLSRIQELQQQATLLQESSDQGESHE